MAQVYNGDREYKGVLKLQIYLYNPYMKMAKKIINVDDTDDN